MAFFKLKKKNKPFWVKHVLEFFRTTGLHGYKYIAMEDTPLPERICWALSLTFCLVVAIIMVVVAWQWNQSNPTLTVIESTHFSIWKFPFPAVTICSLNKVSRIMAFKLSRNLTKPAGVTADEIFDSLKDATAIFGHQKVTPKLKRELNIIQSFIEVNNISATALLDMLTPSCKDMLERCSWKGTTVRCLTLFQRMISSEGHCCSFNYYAYEKHNFPEKIAVFRPRNPRRVAGCGYQTALSVLFRTSPDDYYSSTFGTFGVRIMVHNSHDFADENASSKLVGPGMESFFSIAPEMTYSTPGIAAFHVTKRRCHLPTYYKKTHIFYKYTYNNCLAECRSAIILKACGCIPYFMPANESLPICDFKSVGCLYDMRSIYAASFPSTNTTECKCISDCQHYVYPVELSSGRLTRTNSHNSLSFFKDVTIVNQSLAHVFFNDLVGTRYRKDVFMNWHNLLASFGGLLGLFVGFSLVSGFELVYFFTLRFFFDIAQKKQSKVGTVVEVRKETRHDDKMWSLKKKSIAISAISNTEDFKKYNLKNVNVGKIMYYK